MASKVIMVEGVDPHRIVYKGLSYFDRPSRERIVLKPNLINDKAPPTTTSCDIIEALVKYYSEAGYTVVIAEGSGWSDTNHAFKVLGYTEIAERCGVKLVDLNNDYYEIRSNHDASVLKEFKCPLTLKNSYIVSVPVLKEHSITGVTLSLKNMLGATPGEGGITSRKGRFHRLGIDESIVDVNLHLKPSLAVIDGRIAGLDGELGARPKKLGIVIFSEDLVAADTVGAKLLGRNPLSIKHLRIAQQKGFGTVDLKQIEIVEVEA